MRYILTTDNKIYEKRKESYGVYHKLPMGIGEEFEFRPKDQLDIKKEAESIFELFEPGDLIISTDNKAYIYPDKVNFTKIREIFKRVSKYKFERVYVE